jgi:EmrB/QacA subfamily drug resistance transporter
MLAVALPDLRHAFSVSHAEIAWLVSAYLIAMAVAQPLGGRLGDQLGRERVFRFGLILFLGLSLAAAASPSYLWLIVFRTGQALVGAAVIPNGFAMLRESVPLNRLGRSSGTIGSVVSIAAGIGPILGAALLSIWSWRLLFLMNIPLVLAGLVALQLLRYSSHASRSPMSIDWQGAIAFAGVLVLGTVMLGTLRNDIPVSTMVALLSAFSVCLVAFVSRQFSARTPVAEWRLFRIRSYTGATGYILLSNLVMYTTILTVPFFVEEVQGRSSLTTGSLLGAVSLPVALLSPVGGRVSDEVGRRPPILAGSALMAIGVTAMLLLISPNAPYLVLAAPLALVGVGLGLSTGPASAAAIESSPSEMAGAAAGTNSMMRYIGSIIGAGVLGTILETHDTAVPGIDLFRTIFALLVAMSAGAVLCALLVHRFPARQSHTEELVLAGQTTASD